MFGLKIQSRIQPHAVHQFRRKPKVEKWNYAARGCWAREGLVFEKGPELEWAESKTGTRALVLKSYRDTGASRSRTTCSRRSCPTILHLSKPELLSAAWAPPWKRDAEDEWVLQESSQWTWQAQSHGCSQDPAPGHQLCCCLGILHNFTSELVFCKVNGTVGVHGSRDDICTLILKQDEHSFFSQDLNWTYSCIVYMRENHAYFYQLYLTILFTIYIDFEVIFLFCFFLLGQDVYSGPLLIL